jgi:hypothetical protein
MYLRLLTNSVRGETSQGRPQASFVPSPGLASLLRETYETVSQNAIAVAYRETDR